MERKILWKFNIIDLILIAVVALCLFAFVYKLTWGRDSGESQTYRFTYICESAPAEVYAGIAPGLPCSDGENGVSLGELTEFALGEIPGDSRNRQGSFVTTVSGEPGDHGVSVEDVLYLKGKQFHLVAGDSVFWVYLSDIQAVE